MSKNPIRKDKTCLNCNHVVEKNFCPNCGQENIETRKTFHHLFVHFFEDLTHYENAFWKTIRNLILKPASLTKEYLSGKRMSYLAPFRLYIFISFATFFLIAVIPGTSNIIEINHRNDATAETTIDSLETDEQLKISDSIFGSVKELDSIQKYSSPDERYREIVFPYIRRIVAVAENNSSQELQAKFMESFQRNFPKVLFTYMPIFAFMLWVFQSKKRWYYFDHGIFTLHYFSFLLLTILILFLVNSLLSLFGDSGPVNFIFGIIYFFAYLWMFYYFFAAHHRFYGETRLISVFKGILLFFINSLLISLLLIAYVCYTLINIH